VVGLSAGHTDASASAAIASSASARINIRLVADQQPVAIARRLLEHWNRMVPCGARARMRVIAQAHPVTVDLAHPAVAALQRVLESVWQQPVLAVRNGGTVPIVAELHRRYGMTALMWAASGADDHIHAADESFALADLWRGTEVVARLLAEVAQ
jgi:acetylornithine deacetylase/succinyl-diaminopimelate desuccinylase-like protein